MGFSYLLLIRDAVQRRFGYGNCGQEPAGCHCTHMAGARAFNAAGDYGLAVTASAANSVANSNIASSASAADRLSRFATRPIATGPMRKPA